MDHHHRDAGKSAGEIDGLPLEGSGRKQERDYQGNAEANLDAIHVYPSVSSPVKLRWISVSIGEIRVFFRGEETPLQFPLALFRAEEGKGNSNRTEDLRREG